MILFSQFFQRKFFKLLLALLCGFIANSLLAANLVKDSDTFSFDYEYKIPSLDPKSSADIWLPLGISNAQQVVQRVIHSDTVKFKIHRDKSRNNEILHIPNAQKYGGKSIKIHYEVTRKETAKYAVDKKDDLKKYLRPDSLVPLNERFQQIARDLTSLHKNDMDKARAIYDYVLKEMKYDKSNPDHGRGDAVYACDSKSGNCTDFHALFIAIARAAKIPARFAIGFTIPSNTDIGKIDGYHCWAEFVADGFWVPIDISEAAKDIELKDYFFGHHPANRFELSRGRDLKPNPPPKSGPINFLIHPYVEQQQTILKGTKGFYFFERASKRGYTVEKSMLKTIGDGSGDTHTAVSQPFEPAAKLRMQIDTAESIKLQHRGEAHITAITPPEYKILSAKLNAAQIRGGLPLTKNSKFTIQCLGKGEKSIDGKNHRTYFIVVDHPGLLDYRKKLQEYFEAAGGEKGAFDASKFYPHITLGFLERDLHLQDGITKDRSSCFAGLSIN